jgi:hypothetical protein
MYATWADLPRDFQGLPLPTLGAWRRLGKDPGPERRCDAQQLGLGARTRTRSSLARPSTHPQVLVVTGVVCLLATHYPIIRAAKSVSAWRLCLSLEHLQLQQHPGQLSSGRSCPIAYIRPLSQSASLWSLAHPAPSSFASTSCQEGVRVVRNDGCQPSGGLRPRLGQFFLPCSCRDPSCLNPCNEGG